MRKLIALALMASASFPAHANCEFDWERRGYEVDKTGSMELCYVTVDGSPIIEGELLRAAHFIAGEMLVPDPVDVLNEREFTIPKVMLTEDQFREEREYLEEAYGSEWVYYWNYKKYGWPIAFSAKGAVNLVDHKQILRGE